MTHCYFRYQLATRVSKDEPIPAHVALSWLKNSQEYALRHPRADALSSLPPSISQQQYAEQFGDGMVVKPNKTRLTLHHPLAQACEVFRWSSQTARPQCTKSASKEIDRDCRDVHRIYLRTVAISAKGASTDDIKADVWAAPMSPCASRHIQS